MKWIVALAALGLLGLIVSSTLEQTGHEYEVCVAFKGRQRCATAAGRTPEEAIASAHQIVCSLVTSGRDENMVCLATQPVSTKKLK